MAAFTKARGGVFATGTRVQVGSHQVVVERYLTEGGFAHIYLVRLRPTNASNPPKLAVLKRVAVPDKDVLSKMKVEVDTMKRLRGARQTVQYIDSQASQLKGGGFEVFLLMDYCAGGGLIDFMNTRLKERLHEKEVWQIFYDVAQGVASMHSLRPPLVHRDLKVENILIDDSAGSRRFILCDFGSAAAPIPSAESAEDMRRIEDDIQKNTTLQYRCPEMVEPGRRQPIDEKSDIWALGVFLYKLCYFTTPFEAAGQLAILNARFKYPNFPVYSDSLKLLIATLLRENPADRPSIDQALRTVKPRLDPAFLRSREQFSSPLDQGLKSSEPRSSSTPRHHPRASTAGAQTTIQHPKPVISSKNIPQSTAFSKELSQIRSSSSSQQRGKGHEREFASRYPALDSHPKPETSSEMKSPSVKSSLSQRLSIRMTDDIFGNALRSASESIAVRPLKLPSMGLTPSEADGPWHQSSRTRIARPRSAQYPPVQPATSTQPIPRRSFETSAPRARARSTSPKHIALQSTPIPVPHPSFPSSAGHRSTRSSSVNAKSQRRQSGREMLKGKFSEAFKRFEHHHQVPLRHATTEPLPPDPPSPPFPFSSRQNPGPLSPVPSLLSPPPSAEIGRVNSAEARRDAERQQLLDEERRVEAAREAYLAGFADGFRGRSRATGSLAKERGLPVQAPARAPNSSNTNAKPMVIQAAPVIGTTQREPMIGNVVAQASPLLAASVVQRKGPPGLPKKPVNLKGTSKKTLNGVQTGEQEDDNWEASFAKRFPSLGAIELVETRIEP